MGVCLYRIPSHQPCIKYEVRLKEAERSSLGHLYRIARLKLVAMKEYQEENITKKFMRQLSTPFASTCIIAKTPH